MAVDDGLRLTATLIDEASTPLQRLRKLAGDTAKDVVAGLGRAEAKINSGATGFAAAAGRIGTGMATMGQKVMAGFAAMGRSVAGFAAEAAKAGGAITAAAAGAGMVKGITYAQEVISKGYQRVITMQDATAQSAVLMGGNMEGAKNLMEQIRAVVTGTPFTLPDFAKAGQQMLMYGIGAERIPGILTAIGEATAGNGAEAAAMASRLADTFSKMAAVGQVQLGDMWSIASAGVPALNILANGFNTDTASMKKMIEEGAVPANEAIEILTKGIMEGSDGAAGATMSYAGSMKKLGETWSGALAIYEASKGRLGEAYIEPLKNAMPPLLMAAKGVNDALQLFAPKWKAWLETAQPLQIITSNLQSLAGTIKQLASGQDSGIVTDFFHAMRDNAPYVGAVAGAMSALAGGFLRTIPVIGQFIPVMSPVLGMLVGLVALSPELRSAVGGAFMQIIDALKPLGQVLMDLLEAFDPVLRVLATAITMMMDSLKPILDVLVIAFGRVVSIVGEALIQALMILIPVLADLFITMADQLAPILPVIVAALIGLLEAVMPIVPAVVDLAVKIIELISLGLVKLLDALLPLLPPLIELVTLIIDLAIQAIMPLMPLIVELMTKIIDITLQAILPILPTLFEFIKLVLELASAIGLELIEIVIELFPFLIQFLDLLTPLLPPIMELIELLLKLAIEVITPLIPVIREVADFIGTVLKGAIEVVMPFIEDMIEDIQNLITWLNDHLEPALSVVGGMFDSIGTFISDVVRAVENFVKAGFGWAVDFIKMITGQASGGGIVATVNHVASGGGIAHFAAGGVLGGYAPGHDTVPAMLSPGEAVLVPELVRAIGASNIMAANWAYSHRPAMAGSPSRSGGGLGGNTYNVQIQVDVHAGPDGTVDLTQLRAALESLFKDAERSY